MVKEIIRAVAVVTALLLLGAVFANAVDVLIHT